MKLLPLFSSILLGISTNAFAQQKEVIRITGSASVYPIVSYIYEKSDKEIKKSFKKNPIIESVGTGAGFDAFCKQKFGPNSPDVVNASRPITEKELSNCKGNNIDNLAKITVGLDGIVLAYNKGGQFQGVDLTIEDLQKALSKYIVRNGQVIENNYKTWKEIRADLPKTNILIYGPNSNSCTYDFLKEVIQKQCASLPDMQTHFGKDVKDSCGQLNKNYTQLPDQDSTIARKLELQKNSIAVLRFAFFENSGKFEGVKIKGVTPNEPDIISGAYPLSRPLFVYYDPSYITKVAGLREFLTQIAKFSYSDIASGKNEFNNAESAGVVVKNKGNVKECQENKKLIGFKFNCKANG